MRKLSLGILVCWSFLSLTPLDSFHTIEKRVAQLFRDHATAIDSLLAGRRVPILPIDSVIASMMVVDTLTWPFDDGEFYRFRWFHNGLENELVGYRSGDRVGTLRVDSGGRDLVDDQTMRELNALLLERSELKLSQLEKIGGFLVELLSPNGYWILGTSHSRVPDDVADLSDSLRLAESLYAPPQYRSVASRRELRFVCWLDSRAALFEVELLFDTAKRYLTVHSKTLRSFGPGRIKL